MMTVEQAIRIVMEDSHDTRQTAEAAAVIEAEAAVPDTLRWLARIAVYLSR